MRDIKPYRVTFPYALCIIDMQPHFITSLNGPTLHAVLRLTKEAMSDGAFIVVAQYMNCGRTNNNIRKMLRKYPFKAYCCAFKNNKADAICTKLRTHGVRTHKLKICGVNTEACVAATVINLHKRHKMEIIAAACHGRLGTREHTMQLRSLGLYAHVIY